MYDYDLKNLKAAYKRVGIGKGRVVYLTGNFGSIGKFEEKSKIEVLNTHFSVINDLIGADGTLVVPTHSWSICNSDIPFDSKNTPSETGVFTEFVRRMPGSVRQLHPFSSSTAYGADAQKICADNSRHVYGPNSPFSRMIEADAIHVSVGMHIRKTISLVHHVELIMGVPYRYTKEFMHPCIINGERRILDFYLYVIRRELNITRDKNKKIFRFFCERYHHLTSPLGRSSIQSLQFREFYKATVDLFSKDIYSWLESPPHERTSYQT